MSQISLPLFIFPFLFIERSEKERNDRLEMQEDPSGFFSETAKLFGINIKFSTLGFY